MISNPVNLTVPIAAEVFKKAETYDGKRLFGVTTVDVVKAKTLYAGKAKVPVAEFVCRCKCTSCWWPCRRNHSPIIFTSHTQSQLHSEEVKALTKRNQDGGTEVVEAKARMDSATFSMAYTGAIFADACLKGLNGVPNVVECSFVKSTVTQYWYQIFNVYFL